jgi:hypothetical protein
VPGASPVRAVIPHFLLDERLIMPAFKTMCHACRSR